MARRVLLTALVAVLTWNLASTTSHAYPVPAELANDRHLTTCAPRPADPPANADAATSELTELRQALSDDCVRREQLSDRASDESVNNFGVLHADLWFLAGVIVCGLISYALYRQVMPRA